MHHSTHFLYRILLQQVCFPELNCEDPDYLPFLKAFVLENLPMEIHLLPFEMCLSLKLLASFTTQAGGPGDQAESIITRKDRVFVSQYLWRWEPNSFPAK